MLLLACALRGDASTASPPAVPSAPAGTHGRITFGGDHDYPPFEFLNRNGQPDGFNVDLLRAVAGVMGLEVEFRLGPWEQSRRALEDGSVDVLAMFKSQARERTVDFTEPHTILYHEVFVRRDDAPTVHSLEALRGLEVIVQREALAHDYLREHDVGARLVLVETEPEAIRMLASGDHHCALLTRKGGRFFVRQHGLTHIGTTGPPLLPCEYSLAVREGNSALLERLDEGLDIVKRSGQYGQIYEKWFGPPQQEGPTLGTVLRYVAWTAGPLALLAAGALTWSWALRRQVARRTRDLAVQLDQRRQAEQALRGERDFADRLVETAQAIVLVLDPQGRMLRFNRFAQDLTGYSRPEATGKDWFDTFLPANIRDEARGVFRQVIAMPSGQTFQYVNPILTRHGRQPIIRWFSSLLHGGQGELLGVLSLGYDITEIRRQEEQLREAAKMEAVGRLAGGIAHDFNNMLAIIQGYADLLLSRSDLERDTAGDLEKVRDAARRGALLTRQLLTFARRQVVEPRLLRLNDVMAGLSSMLKRVISEDITLTTDLAGDLWPVRADLSQMEQVLLNLTVNAREAMPQGGRLTVATANRTLPACDVPPGLPAGDYVVLSVTDTGMGMDEETRAHIFEPFYTTKGDRNTGLGLATCLAIVQQCAGHIAVESQSGTGTTFRIYLPRAEVTEKDLAPAAAITPEPAEPPTGTETVLVAEDQPDVRKVTCAMLRRQGYHVLEAANASEAADIARKNSDRPIHLLVTDVVMPDKSGGALAAEVRRIHPTIGVLYVSGYAEKAAAGEPHEPGAQFLAKPFSYRQLAAALRRALDAGGVDPARRR